jgi:hypothetical protein
VGEASAGDGPGTEDTSELDDERLGTYKRLREIADPDAVHDLVASYGPGILDRGLPYLVVAARNRLHSRMRGGHNRFEIPTGNLPDTEAISAWDPLARIAASEQLATLVSTLADMDDRDVLVVWRHAEGVPDDEIRAEWDARGFQPRSPSMASIRKRRERARTTLRALLAPELQTVANTRLRRGISTMADPGPPLRGVQANGRAAGAWMITVAHTHSPRTETSQLNLDASNHPPDKRWQGPLAQTHCLDDAAQVSVGVTGLH